MQDKVTAELGSSEASFFWFEEDVFSQYLALCVSVSHLLFS